MTWMGGAAAVLGLIAAVGLLANSFNVKSGARLDTVRRAVFDWRSRTRADWKFALPLLAGFAFMAVVSGQETLRDASLTGMGPEAVWVVWFAIEFTGAALVFALALLLATPFFRMEERESPPMGFAWNLAKLGAFLLALPAFGLLLLWGIPGIVFVTVPMRFFERTLEISRRHMDWWGIEPRPATKWALVGFLAAGLALTDWLLS